MTTPVLDVVGLEFTYPDGQQALRGSTCTSIRASGSPCSAPMAPARRLWSTTSTAC